MFDVIMYLFENYMHNAPQGEPDTHIIVDELELAGFNKPEIEKAFAWFAGISEIYAHTTTFSQNDHKSCRIYTLDEKKKLGRRCLGFLTFLEQVDVLTPRMRESVIDRALAVEDKRIDIEQLKWITLMVLFHQFDRKEPISPDMHWIENLVFSESQAVVIH